jgi:aspartyl-tRNA(Asn)/glutamyl-tRNA(Gln) amidotransferase subunit B
LNKRAIEKTLLTGLALGCGSPEFSRWDRKNYFYPDMPKNYQTTQMDFPLCLGGGVPLFDDCYPTDARKNIKSSNKVVRLNRIHLEEDVAKSTHLANTSLIDFNRAGTPLMEIVTEPDLESAEEAVAYLRSLQLILLECASSDADMEKGNLRCDVNISLREKESDPLGAKVELKNLNSFSAIRRAIHFEIARQTEELNAGIPQIQSTRRWNDDLGETQLMRTKEDAHDYRYFPCPDLLPIATAPLLETVRLLVPEPRLEKIRRYENDFGLTAYDAAVLTADRHLAEYFEAANRPSIPAKKTANFLINNLLGTLNEQSLTIADCPVTPAKLRDLLTLVENGTLAPNQAKDVFAVLFTSPQRDAKSIADNLGFKPTSTGDLEALIDAAIAANPNEVEAIKAGNEKLLNFLTGQVMKSATSKPNPKQVTDLLRAKLL